MPHSPHPSPVMAKPRPVAGAKAAAVGRPAPSLGAIRVLQNRAAPAQLSLFPRAVPVR